MTASARMRAVVARRADFEWNPPGWLAIVSVVVVIGAYVAVAASARAPVILLDEIVMLGNSWALSGQEPSWTLLGSGFMPGLASLMAPVWWVTEDPLVVYRVGVAITVVSAVVAIWPLARLAELVGLPRHGAVICASVISLAPARLLVVNFLWAETLLGLVLTALVVHSARLATTLALRDGVVFGLLVGSAVFVHGRGVAVAVASAVWCALALARSRTTALAAIGVAFASSVAAYGLYLWASASVLYDDERVGLVGGGLRDSSVADVAARAIGQLWYATFAWPAVVIIGGLYIARRVRKRGWPLLVFLMAATSFVLAVAQLGSANSARIDTWFYGRYMDPIWAIIATIGLAMAVRVRWPAMSAAVVAATAAVSALMLTVTVPRIDTVAGWTTVHVLGIVPWTSADAFVRSGSPPWPLICATAVALAAIVAAAAWVRAWVIPVLGAAWAVLGLAYDATVLDVGYGARGAPSDVYGLARLPQDTTVGLDLSLGSSANSLVIAGFGPEFAIVDLAAGEDPPDAVIASAAATAPRLSGARVYEPTAGRLSVLWVYPGDLQAELEDAGLLLEVGEVTRP